MISDTYILIFIITIIWFILSIIAYEENDTLLCSIQMFLGFFVFFSYIDMDIIQQIKIGFVFPLSILFWSFTVLTYGVIEYRNRKNKNNN